MADTVNITTVQGSGSTVSSSIGAGGAISSSVRTGAATSTTAVSGNSFETTVSGAAGPQGPPGNDGADGYTPIKGVDYFDGADGSDGYTPVKGVDYFDGEDGREVELQKSATHVQWRYTGGSWTDLVALSELKGDTGDTGEKGADGANGQEIELQTTATHIQWRYVGDSWTNLIALSEITGPAGADGADGAGLPAGGTSGQQLVKQSSTDYDYAWQTPAGAGDMLASMYDPQSIEDDAFDRANHTGSQAISTITGLQTALDGKANTSHTHPTTDLTATGGTSTSFLRKDNTWATPTNTTYSEISSAEITAGTASTARAISGRRAQEIVNKAAAAAPQGDVTLAGAQTITGDKTFTGGVDLTGAEVKLPSGPRIIEIDITSTGDKVIAGLNFRPGIIKFFGGFPSSTANAIYGQGSYDGMTQYAVLSASRQSASTTASQLFDNRCIALGYYSGSSWTLSAEVSGKSIQDDGFTVTVNTASSGYRVFAEAYP